MIESPKLCPNCGSAKLNDHYVYIECAECLMTGPKTNGGQNDEHADYLDHEAAILKWNALPRRKK